MNPRTLVLLQGSGTGRSVVPFPSAQLRILTLPLTPCAIQATLTEVLEPRSPPWGQGRQHTLRLEGCAENAGDIKTQAQGLSGGDTENMLMLFHHPYL